MKKINLNKARNRGLFFLAILAFGNFSWGQTSVTEEAAPLPQPAAEASVSSSDSFSSLLAPSVLYQPPLDQSLTSTQIIETALEYSLCPVESEEGKACLAKYGVMERQAKRKFGDKTRLEAAENLVPFMYEGILFKYKIDSTRLNVTLETGEYNCVTASIIYMALATSLGIEVYGQETTMHAFCTVVIDGVKYDVETTNPNGFNPGVKKETSRTENTRTYTTVPKKYYAGQHQISDRAFATLTGKNLASDMNDKNDYDHALPLDVSRLELLKAAGDSEVSAAKSDVDVLSSNYATIEAKAGRTSKALDFLEAVRLKYGTSQILEKTCDNLTYNGVVNYLNENDIEGARTFYNERKENVSSSMQTKIEKMISTQALRLQEYEVHNQIVPLYNTGKYSEAAAILEEALKEIPDSTVLRRDLNTVKKAIK